MLYLLDSSTVVLMIAIDKNFIKFSSIFSKCACNRQGIVNYYVPQSPINLTTHFDPFLDSGLIKVALQQFVQGLLQICLAICATLWRSRTSPGALELIQCRFITNIIQVLQRRERPG